MKTYLTINEDGVVVAVLVDKRPITIEGAIVLMGCHSDKAGKVHKDGVFYAPKFDDDGQYLRDSEGKIQTA